MKVVFSDSQLRHNPQMFLVNGTPRPNPAVPARGHALVEGAGDFDPFFCSRGARGVTRPDAYEGDTLSGFRAAHTA